MRRLLLIAAAATACQPVLDETAYLVTSPRVLAVRGEPAEELPGRAIEYSALVASPEGTLADAPLSWAFCTNPKPITEDNVVGVDCLRDAHQAIPENGTTITATTPLDACTLFGPDPPPGDFRARDPDLTGGYYQPLLVRGAGLDAIAGQRIRCNLGRASGDLSREYRERYVANINPALGDLSLSPGTLGALPRDADVTLFVALADDAREHFVRLDPLSQTIVDDVEALTVSWFVSGGALATRRTSDGENVLHTPNAPGPLFLWIVLRDSRGGVDFADFRATVL